MQGESEKITAASPRPYPFDWSGIDDFAYPRDERGIPRVFIDRRWGWRYNPITVAQLGLHTFTRFAQTGEPHDFQSAKNLAAWLLKTARPWYNDSLAWVYDYDLAFYGPRAPWISAMAQGEAVSLLLRLHELTPVAELAETCERAVRVFEFPVSRGGVVAWFPDGSPIFEEYPTTPPSQVLNGHMFALIGLWDFLRYRWEPRLAKWFEHAIQGLKTNLQRYDTGFWNLYDLHPTRRLTSAAYIRVHAQLLEILAKFTGEPLLAETAVKWRGYLASPWCRARWLGAKCIEKVRLRGYASG